MSPVARAAGLPVDLVLPQARIGFGSFQMDPVAAMLGAKPAEMLGPMLVGAVREEPGPAGGRVEVFPLVLPEGAGFEFPTKWGTFGAGSERGALYLDVPPMLAGVAEGLVKPDVAHSLPHARRWFIDIATRRVVSVPLGTVGSVQLRYRPELARRT